MFNMISQSGHTTYGYKEFVVSTTTDLANLPTNILIGSTAFCIETSKVYMFNGQDWSEI